MFEPMPHDIISKESMILIQKVTLDLSFTAAVFFFNQVLVFLLHHNLQYQ